MTVDISPRAVTIMTNTLKSEGYCHCYVMPEPDMLCRSCTAAAMLLHLRDELTRADVKIAQIEQQDQMKKERPRA